MRKIIGISSTFLFLIGGCNFGGGVATDTLELVGVYSSKDSSSYVVKYKGDKDPFNYGDNKFGYIRINDKDESVSYLGRFEDRYFEFLPSDTTKTTYTFDWYNMSNQKYLTAKATEVKSEGDDPSEDEDNPTSLSLSNITSSYHQGDSFVKPTVYAYYEDGSMKNVSSVATFSGYDMELVADQTVTVAYKSVSTTYQIHVLEKDEPVVPQGFTELVWNDEFVGSSLDNNNWTYDIGRGNDGWGNGEAQYYTQQNATVSDGKLHITAKKESLGGANYTSSRIVTRGLHSFKYGYVEAKISLPTVEGMWPAFWMMPENNIYGNVGGATWPYNGEIDIMEAKGRLANKSSSALHFSTDSGSHTYRTDEYTHSSSIANFHVYAVKWLQDSISFFIDGFEYFKVNYQSWQTSLALSNPYAPFDQNFHIIINLAIGGHFDGYRLPPDSALPNEMLVDYVRVYQ